MTVKSTISREITWAEEVFDAAAQLVLKGLAWRSIQRPDGLEENLECALKCLDAQQAFYLKEIYAEKKTYKQIAEENEGFTEEQIRRTVKHALMTLSEDLFDTLRHGEGAYVEYLISKMCAFKEKILFNEVLATKEPRAAQLDLAMLITDANKLFYSVLDCIKSDVLDNKKELEVEFASWQSWLEERGLITLMKNFDTIIRERIY